MIQKTYSIFCQKWGNTIYPARPNKDDLTFIRKLIISGHHKKLLILGATPEFRELAYKCNMDVTICDINPVMVKAMTRLINSPNKNERVIYSDWLNMPFEDEEYDIILADQSMNIVPFKDWSGYLEESKRVLRNNGLFITRLSVCDDAKDCEKNVLDIKEEFNRRKENLSFLWDMVMHSNHCFDYKKKTSEIKKSRTIMAKLVQEKVITKKQYQIFEKKWGFMSGIRLYLTYKPEITSILENYFKVNQVLTLPEQENYNHKYQPIYVLAKK